MSEAFNVVEYAVAPKVNAASAVPLARKLVAASMKGAPAAIRTPLRTLVASAEEIRVGRLKRRRLPKSPDRQVANRVADNAVGRFEGRLRDYAGLPVERYLLATRARTVHTTLFSGGLAFLQADHQIQWNVTDELLTTIDEDDLGDFLDRVVGPEFLAEVRLAHAAHGQAFGITKALPTSEAPPSLAEPLSRFVTALAEYTLQLAALVASSTTEASVKAAARAALAPIDAFRAMQRSKGEAGAPDEDETPEEPVPVPT